MSHSHDRKVVSRREFMKLVGVGAGAAVLASCAPKATPTPQATPIPKATPIPTLPPKKYEGITMAMLMQAGAGEEPPMKAMAEEFFAETGCKIEIDTETWGNLAVKIQADLASGAPRYALFLNNPSFAYPIYDKLVPLDDYMEKYNYDMTGFFEPVYKYDLMVDPRSPVRYVMPIRFSTSPLWYRTDIVKEFPTTWKGYEELLAANTGGGKYALSVAGVKVQLVKYFFARYWSQGVPTISPDWEILINGPEGVKALTMVKDHITKYAPPGVLAWDNPDADNAFLAGDAVVLESWGHTVPANADNPEKSKIVGKWSIAPYPENGTANISEHCFFIFKTAKSVDAAFEFVARAASIANAKKMAIEDGVMSARKVVWTDPDVVAKRPYFPAFAEVIDRAKMPHAALPMAGELFMMLAEGCSLGVSGQMSIQDALDETAANWAKSLSAMTFDYEYQE